MRDKMSDRYKELKTSTKEKKTTRYTAVFVIMCMLFSIILGKLVYLQVFNVEYYRERANNGRHTMRTYAAPRGEILDRNGKKIATNRQGFSLIYTSTTESKKNFYTTMEAVFKILEENGEEMTESYPLKVDPIRLEYYVRESAYKWADNRFKEDRGITANAIEELFGKGKKTEDLSDEERKQVKEKVLSYDAEYVFKELIKKYGLYNMLQKNYSDEEWQVKLKDREGLVEELLDTVPHKEIRKYLVVKDMIYLTMYNKSKPVVLSNDLGVETAYLFEQIQMELPGISVKKGPIRDYPYNDLGSTLIGNIGKINESDKEVYEEKGYDINEDYIGIAGIESVFEEYLRGTRGEESVEVNKEGRPVKSLGERPATPGSTVQLTIDADIQRAAERALDDTMAYMRELGPYKRDKRTLDDVDKSNATRGAAVVIDVKTGGVLALASRPGTDLNQFTVQGRLDNETYKKIFSPDFEKFGRDYIEAHRLYEKESIRGVDLEGKTKEEATEIIMDILFKKDKNGIREDSYDIYPKAMFNYATNTLAPPGSIFKILTSVAGLEEGVITPTEKIYDAGYYTKRYKAFMGASWMFNLYRGSHGNQNVMEAIRDSNNYYYYEVADRLYEKYGPGSKASLDSIAKYAWKYGLGADMESENPASYTGIEIPERFGQVYYYDYGKRVISSGITRELYDYMIAGRSSIRAPYYKGIDIIPDSDVDSEMAYKIKLDLTKEIKSQMQSEKAPEFEEIERLLSELIESVDEYKGQYENKDIQGMIMAVASSINDAKTEIKTGVNLYNAAIGQGLNNFTPVQLANYVATLVNGGYRYEVHLVDKIVDTDGEVVEDFTKNRRVINETGVSKATIDTVKEGMKMVTSTPNGTAYTTFKGFPILSGGKTGSATFDNYQEDMGRTSYATYIGFAPFEEPEIAVAIMIFDGGHGGYSAEVAKGIYEEYFRERIKEINPEYQFKYGDADLNAEEEQRKENENKELNADSEKKKEEKSAE